MRTIVLALLLLALLAGAAHATGPGVNGKIAFERRSFATATEIWTMDQDGRNLRRVGPGAEPTWSPDGTQIAFLDDDPSGVGNGAVWVTNVDGTGRRVLAGLRDSPVAPAWGPDGTAIAVGGSTGLYVVPVGGGGITSLAPEFFAQWRTTSSVDPKPAWSPDGLQIAFVANDGTVRVIGRDGSGLRALPVDKQLAEPRTRLSWSPDGATIVYVDRGGGLSTVAADGLSAARPLLPQPGTSVDDPVWAPDGRRILFTGNAADICVIEADGSTVDRLTYSPYDERAASIALSLHPSWLSLPSGATPAGAPTGLAGPAADWNRRHGWTPACGEQRVEGRGLTAAASAARIARGGVVTFRMTLSNDGARPLGIAGLVGMGGFLDGGGRIVDRKGAMGCSLGIVPTITCRYGSLFPGEHVTVELEVQATQPGDLVLEASLPEASDTSAPAAPEAVVRVEVSGCSLRGTRSANRLVGTQHADVVCGLEGNDTIAPRRGRDAVYAGPGDDAVSARDGERDTIYCGSGKDTVVADRGDAVSRDCEHVSRR